MHESERPREKAEKNGVASLSNAELLAILLRTGEAGRNALDIANELMSSSGGSLTALRGLDMSKVKGVGRSKSLTILSAFELGRRLYREDVSSELHQVVRSPDDMYKIIDPILRFSTKEECWAYYFDPYGRLLKDKLMSTGSDMATIIDTKQIVLDAIMNSATAVILVHNHPHGSPLPSAADKQATSDLRKALKLVNINLNDHIIYSAGSYYSFSCEEVRNCLK